MSGMEQKFELKLFRFPVSSFFVDDRENGGAEGRDKKKIGTDRTSIAEWFS